MAYPIFISVASQDLPLAEKIFSRYPEGLFYLYSRNGKNNAWMWDEIEREQLPFAKAVAIFWSKNYIRNEGTRRELLLAREFFVERRLGDCVVIRCDDSPLFMPDLGEEDSEVTREAIEAVQVFLRHKRSDPLKQVYPEASRLIDDLVTRISDNDIPFHRRPVEQEEIRDCARLNRLNYRSALWVSGFNGQGRKTLVREMFRELDPNLMGVEVDIDETTLPEQIILRLESEFRGLNLASLTEEAKRIQGAGPEAVAQAIESLAIDRRFALLRQSRVFEESVRLPEWLNEVICRLEPGRFPKLVVVAQLPPLDDALLACGDKLGLFRVPSLRRDDAVEFAWSVVGALGGREEDWTDERVEKIASTGSGNPELIITVIRHALRLPDPTRLDEVIGRETGRFSDTLTHLVTWAFRELGDDVVAKRALLFLDNVSPVSRDEIESFLQVGEVASSVVARLMNLGLLERSQEGLYRISPLLSNRLNFHLVNEVDILRPHRDAMHKFAQTPLHIPDGEHGFVKIEAKIKAELLSGRDTVSTEVSTFVSAAHYLQVGVRLYNAGRYRDSVELLGRAFEKRSAFDLTAQIELCRFYGLALIRMNKADRLDAVIMVLRARFQGHSIADYLEGERRRIVSDYDGALPFYRKARDDAKTNGWKDREEKIIRPYVDCILRSRRPDLALAKQLVDRAVGIKGSVFSLWKRAEVYLTIWYESHTDEDSDECQSYLKVLEDLERDPGAESFYAQVRSMEDELSNRWEDAIWWMQRACDTSGRFDIRMGLWSVKYRSSHRTSRLELIREIEEFCNDKVNRGVIANFAERIARQYALALKANGELRQFRIEQLGLPLKVQEIRQIFQSVNRERVARS